MSCATPTCTSKPPRRPVVVDPGYRVTAVGEDCFVTAVRPGSDAAAKLHPGDSVVQMDGFHVTRSGLFDMERHFHVLSPSPEDRLTLQAPGGERKPVVVANIVKERKRFLDLQSVESNDLRDLEMEGSADDQQNRERVFESGDVAIWKMSRFAFDVDTLSKVMGKVQKHGTLVLDLRDNGGGSVESLQNLMGRLFDHDVKIADLVARKPQKPMMAKHWGRTYTGKLVVLLNSNSASASEIFARTMQLEHRGTVIGDRSAGAVMEARSFDSAQGADIKILYGFSVTVANVIMTDGKSLEGVGVTPDTLLLPTAEDFAAGRDPVLAAAAKEGGLVLDAVQAGKMFPYEWPDL